MRNKIKKVYGVGINDADYHVKPAGVKCQFYRCWSDMLKRCYSDKYKNINKGYYECTVCDEWLTFSNFKRWVEDQDWQGKQLDKDIIGLGNKKYSPETCCFIDKLTNTFVTDSASSRGEFMIGVSWHKRDLIFQSHIRNPLTKRREYLGGFSSEIDAYLAWKKRKNEIAYQMADLQTDERVAGALRSRYK